jgi:Uma2 family endonuclease
MNILLTDRDLTPEDLLHMEDGGKGYELVDGQLVELNVSLLSSDVAGRIYVFLFTHCKADNLGWVFPPETGFQYDPKAPKKVRKPDTGFIRRGRLPETEWRKGFCHIVPDLAVEVVSPNGTFDEVDTKIEEYLRLGVQLVWIVSLETRQVYIHRRDGTVTKVREGGELSGEDVVPGFRCLVRDIFPTPQERAALANGSTP